MALQNSDSLESTAHQLWQAESLPDILKRGLFMRDFRIVPCGDMMQVSFGGESHMCQRPDDQKIEALVALFAPPAVETPEIEIKLDQAAYDG